jgi:hypothetical protein
VLIGTQILSSLKTLNPLYKFNFNFFISSRKKKAFQQQAVIAKLRRKKQTAVTAVEAHLTDA